MKKITLLILALVFITSSAFAEVGERAKGPFGYSLYDDIHRNQKKDTSSSASQQKSETSSANSQNASAEEETGPQFYSNDEEPEWEKEVSYYPNASMSSAVSKYKNGNYSGCLQELFSLVKKDPSNPVAFYYMGMAYTQIGNKDQAVKAYEVVMKLNSDPTITQYATKGRDCLVNGPTCTEQPQEEMDDLDKFINAPYNNGFSPELNKQMRETELNNIKKNINKKDKLEDRDIERIQKFDNKSELEDGTKIASADVSEDDILSAIETLKKAGVNVNINPYVQALPQNSQYQELSMMLGTNNNNNNSVMNMLPYLMNQNQNGQNISPQVFEAMMMNSMLPDFTFNDNNKKY